MKKIFFALLFALTCAVLAQGQLIDYRVTSVQHEIGGTTKSVTGSGSDSNFDSNTAVGDFAVFDIEGLNDSSQSVFTGQLRVTYASDFGNVGSDVMIARTVDSQGLIDDGTFTVLVEISQSGGGGVRLGLDWFEAGTYTGTTATDPESKRIAPIVNFTTFDIDFRQYVSVERSVVSQYALDSSTDSSTVLTATDDGTTISFEDSGANSSVSDPITAAEFTTVAASDYYFEVGKQVSGGNALFMFEMRDPSVNLTTPLGGTPIIVPEVSTAFGLVLVCGLIFFRRPRRRI
jgi:hypothetical protein